MKYALTLLVIMSGLLMQPLQAAPVQEYELKAAFIYNFARFTTWPATQSGNVRLCVMGKDNFGRSLDSIEGKRINELSLTVHHVEHAEAAKTCQILYLGASDNLNAGDVLKQLEVTPVLTVTDDAEIFQMGTMIGMNVENKRIVFDVRNGLVRRAQLSVSSQLLRLARQVHQ